MKGKFAMTRQVKEHQFKFSLGTFGWVVEGMRGIDFIQVFYWDEKLIQEAVSEGN